METPVAPVNVKYSLLVLGAALGGWAIQFFYLFFITFMGRLADDGVGFALPVIVFATFLWVCYYVFGVLMMVRVWRDIAEHGIRTARMMLPGIIACSTVGVLIFVGLVLWCLTEHHKPADLNRFRRVLWTWGGTLFVLLGLLYNIGGAALAIKEWWEVFQEW